MPVDTQHEQYAAANAAGGPWPLMRAVAGGQRTVHAAGETHLPKLSGESQENYEKRRARATFFNATWRTIEGLTGMMFRKDPMLKVSKPTEEMLKDVTKSGVDFASLAKQATVELMTPGRVGILVDYPVGATEGLSVQQAERLNLRPNMAIYLAEAIINWATEWINNKTVLTMVVLHEKAVIKDPLDEFVSTTESRWRVLDLVPATNEKTGEVKRVYRQRVFAKRDGKDVVLETIYPLLNGQLMEHITFRFIGVEDNTPAVSPPPLEDLANVNISHYQTTADLEHGAHKTALPQPYVCGTDLKVDENGVPVKDATLYMGGGDIWSFRNHETQVGMLEYTGVGLEALEKRLESKEKQMAVLGARMLEEQKTGVESAETAGIHRSGEQATLATLARMISKGLKEALGWFDEWAGGTGDVEYAINQKFFATKMTPQELEAQVSSWQQGAMSKEALFENLQNGEIISDARDFEDEENKINSAPPTLAAQAALPPPDDSGNKPPEGE